MSKIIPWDVIPESVGTLLPTGLYKFEIESLEEVQSSKERYMINGTFRVLEPRSEVGMVLYDHYAIGTETDPQADDPKSWEGVAATRFKDLIKKAACEQKPTVEATITAAHGAQFIGDVVQETETKEGPYKGKVRNRLARVYRIGEKDAGTVTMNHSTKTPSVSPFRPGFVK